MELKELLAKQSERAKKRLEELRKCEDDMKHRVDEIKDESEKEGKTEEELKGLRDELDLLDAKKAELEAEKAEKEAELAEIDAQLKVLDEKEKEGNKEDPAPNPERKNFLVFESRNNGGKPMNNEERTKLADNLVKTGKITYPHSEARALLVSSGKIAQPTEVHGIKDMFDYVSSIADLVEVRDCTGMGADRVAYEKGASVANEVVEGNAITESDPEFGYVDILPESNFGTYAEISRNIKKTSPLDYEGRVNDLAFRALKKKVAELVTSKIVADENDLNLEFPVSAIDENTLRNVTFQYGDDESIVGDCWLFLNKKTLIAFGDIVSSLTKLPVYEITPDTANPNTGVIKVGGLSVKYCLNKHLKAIDKAEDGDITMIYGQPKEACELALFGDYEIEVSEDAGDVFKKNMIAIRGTALVGAGVTKYHGFVVTPFKSAGE